MRLGELTQRIEHALLIAELIDDVVRGRRAAGVVVGTSGRWSAPRSALSVDHQVAGHGEEPWSEVLWSFQPVAVTPGPQQHVLNEFLGGAGVAEGPTAVPEQRATELCVQGPQHHLVVVGVESHRRHRVPPSCAGDRSLRRLASSTEQDTQPWAERFTAQVNHSADACVLGDDGQMPDHNSIGGTMGFSPRSILARRRTRIAVGVLTVATIGLGATVAGANDRNGPAVHIEVFAPEHGDIAGIEGRGWFVDLQLRFKSRTLAQSGFSGLQLTGPAGHNNVPPFPGTFSTGRDDRLPGLVVLVSTTNSNRPGFSGPGTNLANLFNVTGVTHRNGEEVDLWDTWIVGADIAGRDVDATLTVAVVGDLNGDGILNDAPNVVTDQNGDGVVNAADLKALGVSSDVVTVPFRISGAPA